MTHAQVAMRTSYASRISRLVGQFVDGCVAFVPFVAAAIMMSVEETTGLILIGVAMFWAVGYLFLADGMEGGQSIGKRMLGMRVVHQETGRPCTFLQSLIRNLLLSILGPIDWIFIFGSRHQRLGDMLANTVVIDAD